MIRKYRHGEIHQVRAEAVYPLIEPGSVRLVISDGPYAMGKASWDAMPMRELGEWYRPHIAEWGRLCMASASVYLWGSAESWAAIHPEMLAAGWDFRCLIVWDKGPGGSVAIKAAPDSLFTFPDITEVCGLYQREAFGSPRGAGTSINYAAGADDRNWIRLWLASEWSDAGMRNRDADKVLGKNGMAGHYFGASQWSLPTWDAYERLALHAQTHGPARDRPYFIHPMAKPDELRASYDHLRAEYDLMRCPFRWDGRTTNVWSETPVRGAERLLGADGGTLHPCQKPTIFATRQIITSTRPGELVLEPFGGTCRVAVACEGLSQAEARRYVCAEPDEDGLDYLGAVDRQLSGMVRQATLF